MVPYEEPLTQRLADGFNPYLQRYNAFLMENHGLVVTSREDIRRAFQLTDVLETSAISIVHALALGGVKEISREGVRDLEKTMRARSLPAIGNPECRTSLLDLYFGEKDE